MLDNIEIIQVPHPWAFVNGITVNQGKGFYVILCHHCVHSENPSSSFSDRQSIYITAATRHRPKNLANGFAAFISHLYCQQMKGIVWLFIATETKWFCLINFWWELNINMLLQPINSYIITVTPNDYHQQITSTRLFSQPFVKANIKENSKARVTGSLWGESTGDWWTPTQRASNAENVSIWWRHHDSHTHIYICIIWCHISLIQYWFPQHPNFTYFFL